MIDRERKEGGRVLHKETWRESKNSRRKGEGKGEGGWRRDGILKKKNWKRNAYRSNGKGGECDKSKEEGENI